MSDQQEQRQPSQRLLNQQLGVPAPSISSFPEQTRRRASLPTSLATSMATPAPAARLAIVSSPSAFPSDLRLAPSPPGATSSSLLPGDVELPVPSVPLASNQDAGSLVPQPALAHDNEAFEFENFDGTHAANSQVEATTEALL
jgi:hypothetical protein